MDLSNCITISLKDFGMPDGEIVMAPPTMRKFAWLKNQIGKHAKMRNGQMEMDGSEAGEIEVLNVLAHVREAPFPAEIEPFYQFCDKLDSQTPGLSVKIFTKMSEAVASIDKGETSPFA